MSRKFAGLLLIFLLAGAGLAVVGGTSLYRLTESPKASEWFGRLGCAGILVRRFTEQPNWLRFGLPAVAPTRLKRVVRSISTISKWAPN